MALNVSVTEPSTTVIEGDEISVTVEERTTRVVVSQSGPQGASGTGSQYDNLESLLVLMEAAAE